MKKQFCKILLAVSFLFLVPALCMSQNLKGIWKLVQSEGSSQVVRYKVLDKDGNYFNVVYQRCCRREFRQPQFGRCILPVQNYPFGGVQHHCKRPLLRETA